MPTFITEFTKRLGPGDLDYEERGVVTQKWKGPYIVASSWDEAEWIATKLMMDPDGVMPVRVAGVLDEEIPADMNMDALRRFQLGVASAVGEICMEREQKGDGDR